MIIKDKFQNIIDLVSNVMEAHTTALFVNEKNGELIRLYCSQSFSKKIKKNLKIKKGEGIIGWVYREQKNVVYANFDKNSKKLGIYEENIYIKSMMAVYLPKKRGVLFIDSKRSYAFTEEKEKIFKQMAAIIFFLMIEQEKIDENLLIKRALEANLKIDKSIYNFIDLQEVFKEISICLHLKYLVFFREDNPIYICQYDEKEKKYLFKSIEKEKYSEDGLIGWCQKKRKKIFTNRENDNDKTFIIHKEDGLKNDNILAVPLRGKEIENEKYLNGVVVFSKRKDTSARIIKNKEFWNTKEIEILENVGIKILKIISSVRL